MHIFTLPDAALWARRTSPILEHFMGYTTLRRSQAPALNVFLRVMFQSCVISPIFFWPCINDHSHINCLILFKTDDCIVFLSIVSSAANQELNTSRRKNCKLHNFRYFLIPEWGRTSLASEFNFIFHLVDTTFRTITTSPSVTLTFPFSLHWTYLELFSF